MFLKVEVEQALININDAVFHELGDRYFEHILKPSETEVRGRMKDKHKSRPGTPDTIMKDQKGRLFLIEYTTLSRKDNPKKFLKKIESDIRSCFSDKSKINREDVYQIIICHTSALKSEEIKELRMLCREFNPTCTFRQVGFKKLVNDIYKKYPDIVNDFLQVPLGSGQILKPDEFIRQYEGAKQFITTQLSNPFMGRKEELNRGVKALSDKDMLVIKGKAGIGKTRFGLELCRCFCEIYPDYSCLCVKDLQEAVNIDIQRHIIRGKKYILFMDDANRISFLESFMDRMPPDITLKYVLTVRDYGWESIKTTINLYKSKSIHTLDNLRTKQIIEIISSSPFEISDRKVQSRIVEIAKGNCRIALMYVDLIKGNKDLMPLDNVSNLYDVYFEKHYESLEKRWGTDGLKVLGLISFYRVISGREDEDIIFETFHVDKVRFWEICRKLHDAEVVYLTEGKSVSMSDQVFATFVFYHVFLKDPHLDFISLLDRYLDFDYYTEHELFPDAFMPVINTYTLEEVSVLINGLLLPNWEERIQTKKYDEIVAILDIIGLCIPEKTLEWIEEYAEKEDEMIVDILLRISNLEDYFYETMTLLCDYLIKNPSVYFHAVHTIKDAFNFSHSFGPVINKIYDEVFDFFYEVYKSGEDNFFYRNILWDIIPGFLKNEFCNNVGQSEENTGYLSPNKAVFHFRKKIWDFIDMDFDYERFLLLLPQLYNYQYNKDACREIFLQELPKINKTLRKLDLENDFNACLVVDSFFRKLEDLAIDPEEHIQVVLNKYYRLDTSLKCSELTRQCYLLEAEEYRNLFREINQLQKLKDGSDENQQVYTGIMETVLEKDADMFRELLAFVLSSTAIPLMEYKLVSLYFTRENEATQLYDILTSVCKPVSFRWQWAFHTIVPKELIQADFKKYAADFYSLPEKLDSLPVLSADPFHKYADYMPFLQGLSYCITHIIRLYNQGLRWEKDKSSLLFMIRNCPGRLDDLENIYFLTKDADNSFDRENEVLKELLINNEDTIIHYYRHFLSTNIAWIDIKKHAFGFIFELENYVSIIEKAIFYLYEEDDHFNLDKLSILFMGAEGESEEKMHAFLLWFIGRNARDVEFMKWLFKFVASFFEPDTSIKSILYMRFIQFNKDFKAFKQLPLHSKRWRYKEERNHCLDKKLDFLNLKSLIEGNLNKLHLAYINRWLNNFPNEMRKAEKEMERLIRIHEAYS